jgi:cytochrome c oxidase subunit 2
MIPTLLDVLAARDPKFWLPPQASTTSGDIDFVFSFIFWVSAFFFALIVGLMVFFLIRYRRRKPGQGAAPDAPEGNVTLELVWSAIPFVLVVVMFWLGFKTFMDHRTAPGNAYEVSVTGMKWAWQFEYANGWVENELNVPADTPVRLVMTSEDVIHSLSIPAFRVKQDVVPGRYTEAWFRCPEPGRYRIFCTEYCGTKHGDMLSWVVVHPPGEFEKWLEDASNFVDRMAPAEAGKLLFEKRGCAACHSVDGSASRASGIANEHRRSHRPGARGDGNELPQLLPGPEVLAADARPQAHRRDVPDRIVAAFVLGGLLALICCAEHMSGTNPRSSTRTPTTRCSRCTAR